MTPSFPTKFATALRAFFAQHLPLTRGLSPRTVSSYRDTFVLLLRFLAARHGRGVVDLELQHLRADDLLAFLDHLETERKNSVATRNARLAAIHAFARFLATRDPEQMEEAQRLLAVRKATGAKPSGAPRLQRGVHDLGGQEGVISRDDFDTPV